MDDEKRLEGWRDRIADPDPIVGRSSRNPVETGTLVNQAGYRALPERLLWRCVLLQAVYDAKGGLVRRRGRHVVPRLSPRRSRISGRQQQDAISWFGTPDFYTVCDLADVQPEVAMRAVGRKENCCEKKAS